MSSIENLSAQINNGLHMLPEHEIQTAVANIQNARDALAAVDVSGIEGGVQKLDSAIDSATRAGEYITAGRTGITGYLTSIGTATEASMPAGPPVHETLRDVIATSIDSIQEVLTTRGFRYNTTSELERVKAEAAEKLVQLQPLTQEALRDPVQFGVIVDVLCLQRFDTAGGQIMNEITDKFLKDVLYADNGQELAELAAQTENPEAAGKAIDAIIATYPWIDGEAPAVTKFITANYRAVLSRYTTQKLDSTSEQYNGRSNTMAAMCRAIAEAPVQDMAELMQALKKGNIDGGYPRREVTSLYKSALEYLCHGDYQEQFLRKVGLDSDRIFDAWAAGHGGRVTSYAGRKRVYTNTQFMRDNVINILELEVTAPGICKTLNDTLGICSFARYTQTTLREAYEALSNPPTSYILNVVAHDDYNGAFNYTNATDVIRQQMQDHDPDARVIPVELNSFDDMWRTARQLRKLGFSAAEHAIIGGHGTPQSTELGKDAITIRGGDSAKSSWHALGILARSIVKPDGTITMSSCSTGLGLAQHIANVSGRTTFAPGEDVAVGGIDMRLTGSGQLVPEIHYVNSTTSQPRPTLTFTPHGKTVSPAKPTPPTGPDTTPSPRTLPLYKEIQAPSTVKLTGLLRAIQLLNEY